MNSKRTYLILSAFALVGIALVSSKQLVRSIFVKQPQHPNGCALFSIGTVCFDADNPDLVIAGGTSSEAKDSSVYAIKQSGNPERHIYSWSEGERSFKVAWRPSDPNYMRLITYCQGKEIRNELNIVSHWNEDDTWKLNNPEQQYFDCPAAKPNSPA